MSRNRRRKGRNVHRFAGFLTLPRNCPHPNSLVYSGGTRRDFPLALGAIRANDSTAKYERQSTKAKNNEHQSTKSGEVAEKKLGKHFPQFLCFTSAMDKKQSINRMANNLILRSPSIECLEMRPIPQEPASLHSMNFSSMRLEESGKAFDRTR